MGLPIALGGKTVSSRRLLPPSFEESNNNNNDNIPRLEPRILHDENSCHYVCMTANEDLSVVCSIHCYDNMNDNDNQNTTTTIADIRIQVSPLSEPYSSAAGRHYYRDALYRMKLPNHTIQEENNHTTITEASVVISSDGRHVACVVPHTKKTSSIVVMFQLRKPRTTTTMAPPSRPSYLMSAVHNTDTDAVIPVATNPRILMLNDDNTCLLTASCLCDVSISSLTHHHQNTPSSCMLLIGCVNGSIYAASYKDATIQQHLFQTRVGIRQLRHINVIHNGGKGRLVALLQQGMAVLFHTNWMENNNTTDSSLADTTTRNNITAPPHGIIITITMEPWIDLDGPFVDAQWISPGCYLALLCHPTKAAAAAEVWALPTTNNNNAAAAEPISTLTMTTERLEESQHGTFRIFKDSNNNDNEDSLQQQQQVSMNNAMGIHYDEESGCLAVSSIVYQKQDCLMKPFSCIWNWRTNVVGLTLAARQALRINNNPSSSGRRMSLLSRLFFAKKKTGGCRLLVHCIADVKRNSNENRIRKEIFVTGILSPPNAMGGGHASTLLEASSLMLSSKSVAFPVATRPLTGDEGEVSWIESRIPTHYTSLFGAPRIGTIVVGGSRSVAIAGSYGLCVLDYTRALPPQNVAYGPIRDDSDSKQQQQRGGDPSGRLGIPKWRMFGSEAEERSFRVLAMMWWRESNSEQTVDDLLVAVIQDCREDADGRAYLSCWSRRRLDMQNQLLRPARGRRSSNPSTEMGIALPHIPVGTCSISLLSQPRTSQAYRNDRKAVVLISAGDGSSSGEDQNRTYFLYHLQASPSAAKERDGILSELGSHGLLCSSDSGFVLSVFLAGCSFQFDLLTPKNAQVGPRRFLASVGIVYAAGRGIDAVIITPSGSSMPVPLIGLHGREGATLKSCEVSALWQSETVVGSDSASQSCTVCSFFAWTVMMRDGSLYCWTVPFLDYRHEEMIVGDEGVTRSSNILSTDQNGLRPPVFLCTSEDDEATMPLLLGTVAHIGDSATWLQDSSNANRAQFSLGCLPGSEFGCILRCTQGSRDLHRVAPGESEGELSGSSLLDYEIFYLGDTSMAPPAFVSPLFATLLGSANEHALRICEGSSIPRAWDFKAMKKAAILTIKSRNSQDTITTALRVLILRVVEQVAIESEKSRGDSVVLAMALFTELVDAARCLVTPMQFVSLFLGVARQVEPSCIPHLFPLPLSTAAFRNDAEPVDRWRSVNDLFVASLYHGSLSSPSSALPLFASKRTTLLKCIDLLKRCLRAFEESTRMEALMLMDGYREERAAIRDLFLFGTKLENAGPLDEKLTRRPIETVENGQDENSLSTVASSFVNVRPPQQTRARRSICSFLLPSILTGGKYRRAHEEDAIHEAASSFISSGFEESDYEFVPLTQASVPLEISYEDVCEVTVAGTIVDFLLSLCLDHKPVKPYYRWKKARALAQIILGEDGKDKTLDDSSSLVIGFKNLAALIPLSAFSVLAKATGRTHDDSIGSKELVADLMTVKIVECNRELDAKEALLLLRFLCKLLARHDKSKDVESCISGIIFLGVVAGHVAGIAKDLLGQTFELSAIGSSYAVALSNLQSRAAA